MIDLESAVINKNFVQPATGVVLHGWAYYLWLGGHYGAGVYPRDIVSNRIYKLVMSSVIKKKIEFMINNNKI